MHISDSGVNHICQKKKKSSEILQQKFHSQSIKPQVQKFKVLNCENCASLSFWCKWRAELFLSHTSVSQRKDTQTNDTMSSVMLPVQNVEPSNLNLATDPRFQTPVWYKIQWDLSAGKQHCVQSFGKGDISFIKKSHATGLSQLWRYCFFLSLNEQNLYFSSTPMRCEYDVMHTDRHAFPGW